MPIKTSAAHSIQVTKTYLPPQEEFEKYLDKIWNNGWLTNKGPLVSKLEKDLKAFLKVPNLEYVSNGTVALQLAINALELDGEIITTPYSYVATTSAILWQKCKPVYVDICEDSFGIDPDLIEDKISEKTSAILATHVYGIPCNIEKITAIAKKHNLKVIYDAAHAFGVSYKEKSLYNYGDISIASFHATKVYHTVEGGALITQDKNLSNKIDLIKAFGHDAQHHYLLGMNGKNSEFHAAMGLCNLIRIEEIIALRKEKFFLYSSLLKDLPLKTLKIPKNVIYNYGYFPVVFNNFSQMMQVKNTLEKENIFCRRYFHPSLNTLSYVEGNSCPVSEAMADKILCLPFYHELDDADIRRISFTIKKALAI